MSLYWFTTGNTEVRLFVIDSTAHAFDMYNCLLKVFRILMIVECIADLINCEGMASKIFNLLFSN